jgi:hypothetical protein
MAVGFPAKTTYATGDVLTATDVNDITGTLNLLQSTLYPAGRNKLINGKFDIWQRGTGTFSTDGAYTADRWILNLSGATAGVTRQSFTVGQTDVPNNPDYFLRLAVTTGDNGCRIAQKIENVATFAAETVTISFYAKGTNPASGSLEIYCSQDFGSGGSAVVATLAGSIVLTSSWQRFTKTVTLPSISGKTVGTSSFLSVQIQQPTADTGIAAWTLDLSSVQIENGSTASPFQTASGSIGGELALCQRYYYRNTGGQAYSRIGFGLGQTTTNGQIVVNLPVTMRTAPTAVDYSTLALYDGTTITAVTSVVLSGGAIGPTVVTLDCAVASGLTVFRPYELANNNSTSAYVGLSAEL